jgi:triphosphoribosyl-dephospho-CoA synthase
VSLPPLPARCGPGGRGFHAAVASILEARAAKPGNVHPGASFPDLAHADLVAAAVAIAAPLEDAPRVPLGRTILAAVTAARAATPSNANLGIILAIAPLAAVPAGSAATDPAGTAAVLAGLTPADAADVWRAIALANPGGLGKSPRHDLAGPPPADLLDAMRAAADRDSIARLWAEGYAPLHAGLVADIAAALDAGAAVDDAIVRGFLAQLAREPDSLIVRRHGLETARDVSRRAAAALARPALVAEFDRSLRTPRRINPGTTADLTAAALYVLLESGRLVPRTD